MRLLLPLRHAAAPPPAVVVAPPPPADYCCRCVALPRHRLLLPPHTPSPPPYDLSLAPSPEFAAAAAITKHTAELPISLHSSPPDSIPPSLGSQMHDEASTPLHGVELSQELHSLASPELPDHHRLPHCLNSLPRCLPAVEIAADDFALASSSCSAARRRSSSVGAPSRLDSGEDAAREHPYAATGEDDSYPARSNLDGPDRLLTDGQKVKGLAQSAPSLQSGYATSPINCHLGKVNFQLSMWR
jgi:hypothetical protein